MDYRESGVDIEAGEAFVRKITPLVRSTFRPEVLGDLGGFGGLFRFPAGQFTDPVLVSGTDGVGTKLKVAFMLDRHDTIGVDLVAMCVNDIVVSGAEPLFFLDYLATGRLRVDQAESILKGIIEGCRQAGCALIGGETAEMPSMYQEGEYDLAGFAVGVVERANIIDGSHIKPGDVILGLASSGPHSNGYSLIRKVLFEHAHISVNERLPGDTRSVGDVLLAPTRIYVPTILQLIREFSIGGMAHITGGGLTGNVPRVLPRGCMAEIRRGSWTIPPIFTFVQEYGAIALDELYRVLNMGIGMVLIVSSNQVSALEARMKALGETVWVIGSVVQGDSDQPVVRYRG